MHSIRLTAILAASLTTILVGCSSPKDANETNFAAAIETYLAKRGRLCLNSNRWPIDIPLSGLEVQLTSPTSPASQMAALESVGLVSWEPAEAEVKSLFGSSGEKEAVRRYTLTDKAAPYSVQMETERFGSKGMTREMATDLCWGQKSVDTIVKWEGPMVNGDYQSARVVYTYKINNKAPWADDANVHAAFPLVLSAIANAQGKEYKRGVRLTNVGWEAKEAF